MTSPVFYTEYAGHWQPHQLLLRRQINTRLFAGKA